MSRLLGVFCFGARWGKSFRSGSELSTVEVVALWTGLFASIVGVVLAIVSILFTRSVETRSSKLNTDMIQTLQKIESAVERSTDDTANLIKVAWDRMLPNMETEAVESGSNTTEHEFAKEIAAGVASELRSELATASKSDSQVADLDAIVRKLQRTVERQLETGTDGTKGTINETLRARVKSASPTTRALLSAIFKGGHLTRDQYKALREGDLSVSLDGLRRRGLLVPLSTRLSNEPVYWIAPDVDRDALKAFMSMYESSNEAMDYVRRELASVGYPKPSDDGVVVNS